MKLYLNHPSWLRYQDILKRRFRIALDHEPVEARVPVRGHDIHVDAWEPETPAHGTVLLVHGGGGHGRILAPLGDAIARMGWRAVAPDLPGYGLTVPSHAFAWDYEEWLLVLADLARRQSGPVVLFGLSMGGLTAVLAAQRSPGIAGVVATTMLDMGNAAAFAAAARWRWLGHASLLGFKLVPALVDRLALPLRLAAPMDAMSSDAELTKYFQDDELLGSRRVPSRFFRTAHACKADRLQLPCPLLVLHPGADAWTPTDLTRPVFERVATAKRMQVLTNGSHLPLENPAFGEIKVELERFLSSTRGDTATDPPT